MLGDTRAAFLEGCRSGANCTFGSGIWLTAMGRTHAVGRSRAARHCWCGFAFLPSAAGDKRWVVSMPAAIWRGLPSAQSASQDGPGGCRWLSAMRWARVIVTGNDLTSFQRRPRRDSTAGFD